MFHFFKFILRRSRQALDGELRKLQESIKTGCEAFDARLQELFQAKMATEQAVTCEELRMLKLAKSLQDQTVRRVVSCFVMSCRAACRPKHVVVLPVGCSFC